MNIEPSELLELLEEAARPGRERVAELGAELNEHRRELRARDKRIFELSG